MNFASLRLVLLVAAVLLTPTWAAAQTTIYNSGGFESFTTGTIVGQQGFDDAPDGIAGGQIQNGTAFGGTGQAFRIVGQNVVSNTEFQQHNFWYKQYAQNAVNPTALGTPFVQVRSQFRMSGLGSLSDIPFAGLHLEGYTSFGFTQVISPIFMAADGTIRVHTTGGTVLQSAQTFAREQWHDVFAEFNFTNQTYIVYVNGTVLTFNGSSTVAFRNTFGTTTSLYEIGYLATFNTAFSPTLNDFYADDFVITRSASSISPVPEPAACLAVAGLALAGYRRLRKRPAVREE